MKPNLEDLMKLFLNSILALALAGAGTAFAQTEPVPQQPAVQPAVEVTDADMEKFAEIYVDVETRRAEVADELTTTEEPVEAEEAQVRLQQELVATIEGHGWTVDRYNVIATAISNDPAKRDKTVELINRIVSG